MQKKHLELAYKQMAKNESREAEALAWSEGTFRDVAAEAGA